MSGYTRPRTSLEVRVVPCTFSSFTCIFSTPLPCTSCRAHALPLEESSTHSRPLHTVALLIRLAFRSKTNLPVKDRARYRGQLRSGGEEKSNFTYSRLKSLWDVESETCVCIYFCNDDNSSVSILVSGDAFSLSFFFFLLLLPLCVKEHTSESIMYTMIKMRDKNVPRFGTRNWQESLIFPRHIEQSR